MTDPIRKASEAALMANAVTVSLLAASSDFSTRAQQVQHLAKAFQAFEPLKRLMADLERAAPNCARAGQDEAAKAAEVRA